MKQVFDLTKITAGQHEPLPLFAVTSLGIIESLAAGSLTPTEAIHAFFHGKNIRFVKMKLGDDRASDIMGRGVQFADLFDAMPVEEAHREFQHELHAIKSLSCKLLELERAAAWKMGASPNSAQSQSHEDEPESPAPLSRSCRLIRAN